MTSTTPAADWLNAAIDHPGITEITEDKTETETPTVRTLRKKPVTVTTLLWDGTNAAQLAQFTGGRFATVDPEDRGEDPDITGQVFDVLHSTWVGMRTGQSVVRGIKGEFYPIDAEVLDESYDEAGEPETIRTYRVQYNPGSADGDTETYIDAESYRWADTGWLTFTRDGRDVTEIRGDTVIVIEELRPLSLSEREELEELRETVAMADLARSLTETREAAARDRERATDDESQTDWAAYHACGTCGQPTGKPCRFGGERIDPHVHRERISTAA